MKNIPESKVHNICKLISAYYNNKEIADHEDVSTTLASRIREMELYTDISKKYFKQAIPNIVTTRGMTSHEKIKAVKMVNEGKTAQQIKKKLPGYPKGSHSSIKRMNSWLPTWSIYLDYFIQTDLELSEFFKRVEANQKESVVQDADVDKSSILKIYNYILRFYNDKEISQKMRSSGTPFDEETISLLRTGALHYDFWQLNLNKEISSLNHNKRFKTPRLIEIVQMLQHGSDSENIDKVHKRYPGISKSKLRDIAAGLAWEDVWEFVEGMNKAEEGLKKEEKNSARSVKTYKKYLTLFRMYVEDGMSVHDIAKETDMNQATVSNILYCVGYEDYQSKMRNELSEDFLQKLQLKNEERKNAPSSNRKIESYEDYKFIRDAKNAGKTLAWVKERWKFDISVGSMESLCRGLTYKDYAEKYAKEQKEDDGRKCNKKLQSYEEYVQIHELRNSGLTYKQISNKLPFEFNRSAIGEVVRGVTYPEYRKRYEEERNASNLQSNLGLTYDQYKQIRDLRNKNFSYKQIQDSIDFDYSISSIQKAVKGTSYKDYMERYHDEQERYVFQDDLSDIVNEAAHIFEDEEESDVEIEENKSSSFTFPPFPKEEDCSPEELVTPESGEETTPEKEEFNFEDIEENKSSYFFDMPESQEEIQKAPEANTELIEAHSAIKHKDKEIERLTGLLSDSITTPSNEKKEGKDSGGLLLIALYGIIVIVLILLSVFK